LQVAVDSAAVDDGKGFFRTGSLQIVHLIVQKGDSQGRWAVRQAAA
jgi:hypothetical protein